MSIETQDYHVVTLAADEGPTYPKLQIDRAGWVKFGDKNLFPQEMIKINGKSPVNTSIIDSTVTYICGKGVRDTEANAGKYVGVPNTSESWDEVIERLAKDYKTFGGFYFQVIVNKGSTTVSIFHQDYSEVRIGEIDERGAPITFRIAGDWAKTSGKNKPIELPVWPGSVLKAKRGVAYLYHFWDYIPGMKYYAVPGYFPALDYVKADGSLGEFYNNSINNGFTPSVVISMPSNPSEEKKAEIQKQMEAAFSGAKGASSIVMVWGENTATKPLITPFNASANADIYNNVEGIVFQKIISAHRLSSPTLAGVSGGGNLSGNAAEIIDAFVLYNYTVVAKMRLKILDHLNKFTKINGTSPLIINDLDVIPRIRESEEPAPSEAADGAPVQTLSRKEGRLGKALKNLLNIK